LGIINEFDLDKNSNDASLLTHANLALKRELQFMDIVDDEEDEDISFVPNAILDHRVMKTPQCEIHKSKDQDGKEVTKKFFEGTTYMGTSIMKEWGNILGFC